MYRALAEGWIIALLCCPAVASVQQRRTVTPVPEIQERLERIGRAGPRKLEFYSEMLALKELSREVGFKTIVEQAALYSSRWSDDKFRNTLHRLARHWGADESGHYQVVRALLPHLTSDDERLRGFVEDYVVAKTPVQEDSLQDPTILALVDFVSERRADPPWRAVQILYWRAPSAALLELASSWSDGDEQGVRALRWSEHLIADAVWKEAFLLKRPAELDAALEQLDKLSQHNGWWVRLYVAEMVRRHEMFRRDDILKRLRSDPIPLVANAADVPYYGGMSEDEYRQWKKQMPWLKPRPP